MASHGALGPSTPFVTIAELAAQPCADGLIPDVEADAAVLTGRGHDSDTDPLHAVRTNPHR